MKNLYLILIYFFVSISIPIELYSQNSELLGQEVLVQEEYKFTYTFKSYNYHADEAYFDPSIYRDNDFDAYQFKEYIENTLIIFLICERVGSNDRYLCENYRVRPDLGFSIVSSDFCTVINQANKQKNEIRSLPNTSTYYNGRRIDFDEAYSINIYKDDPLKPICSIKNKGFIKEFGKMTEDQINKYYASQTDCSCQDLK